MGNINEAREKLAEGVKATIESGEFRAYLDVMSKFYNYSPNNVMMIMMQRPDATRVAGFRKWLELGRHVRKGEKGITIIVPMMSKKKDANGDEITIPRFGTGHVFDISQTDGEDLPDIHVPPLTGDDAIGLSPMLEQMISDQGWTLEHPELDEDTGGYCHYKGKVIALRKGLFKTVEGVSVLIHEIAHSRTENVKELDRGAREAVAEGTAYIVCRHFGIDTGESSFPYIAGWVQDHDRFMETMGGIHKIAGEMVRDIERIQGGQDVERVNVA